VLIFVVGALEVQVTGGVVRVEGAGGGLSKVLRGREGVKWARPDKAFHEQRHSPLFADWAAVWEKIVRLHARD